MIMCEECGGTGKVSMDDDYHLVCEDCGGTGKVPDALRIFSSRPLASKPLYIDDDRLVAMNIRTIPYKLRNDYRKLCIEAGITMSKEIIKYLQLSVDRGRVLTDLITELEIELEAARSD